MSIQDEIIKTIKMMVSKEIENQRNLSVASVVTEVKGNKYKVIVDGAEYWVKDGVNINPTVGMAVWLYKPNGNINNMFIMAKK